MSAFQVHPNHIGAIVRWYFDYGRAGHCLCSWRSSPACEVDAGAMMTALSEENARSVNYRYPTGDPQVPDPFPEFPRLSSYAALSPIEVIKACHCLKYQSCEHPTYEGSEAAQLTRQIVSAAISVLPGYQTAPWGIDYGSAKGGA